MAIRDSAATRARILDAAIEEFSAYGLAGARVDRIAASAAANKRAIYDYFGGKDQLFQTAVTTTIDRLNAAVTWTPEDLPGYTARLFDYHVAHPESIRMATWRTLEHPGGPEADLSVYEQFADMVESRPGGARDDALAGVDLSILLLSLAAAWSLANRELLTLATRTNQDADPIRRHRAGLVEAMTRLTQPPDSTTSR